MAPTAPEKRASVATFTPKFRICVRLTGMPGWAKPHDEQGDDSWKLVLFIRRLRQVTSEEHAQQSATANSAHYAGSQSCQKCHAQIYEHWRKTPMANVVRDPRDHPD